MASSLAATQALPIASSRSRAADVLLLASFFVSGAAALMYQVCWQRALYAQIGVDTDSVTIIVSVFMLGIGLGGMLGGWLADRFPRRRVQLYVGVECAIGAFGLASLAMLGSVAGVLAGLGSGTALATAAACFVFLLVPTTLMGITLPVLTMAFDEHMGNIGVSVGTLYFANTFGAALGAALVPFALLPRWGISQVVGIAALCNLLVAGCALGAIAFARKGQRA